MDLIQERKGDDYFWTQSLKIYFCTRADIWMTIKFAL